MNNELIVDGYIFGTMADADLAREESERIKYLDDNMNYANIPKVLQLYNRALDTKMFQTPVGWEYLIRLKNLLLSAGVTEPQIRPIPLYNVFAREEEPAKMIDRIQAPTRKKKDVYRRKYAVSVLITCIMVVLVIVLFFIALHAETPNMLNYRNAIINDYADWEQDIRERENKVREKERELEMVSPLPHVLDPDSLIIDEESEDKDKDE